MGLLAMFGIFTTFPTLPAQCGTPESVKCSQWTYGIISRVRGKCIDCSLTAWLCSIVKLFECIIEGLMEKKRDQNKVGFCTYII